MLLLTLLILLLGYSSEPPCSLSAEATATSSSDPLEHNKGQQHSSKVVEDEKHLPEDSESAEATSASSSSLGESNSPEGAAGDSLEDIEQHMSEDEDGENDDDYLVLTVEESPSFLAALRSQRPRAPAVLMLLMIYDPSCHYCVDMLIDLEVTSVILKTYFEKLGFGGVICARMNVNDVGPDWLSRFDPLDGVPELRFVLGRRVRMDTKAGEKEDDDGEQAGGGMISGEDEEGGGEGVDDMDVMLFPYSGFHSDVEEITTTTLHYWYRYVYTAILNNNDGYMIATNDTKEEDQGEWPIDPPVFALKSLRDLMQFWEEHRVVSTVKPQLDPNLSEEEKDYIYRLLDCEDEENMFQSNGIFRLVVSEDKEDLSPSNDGDPFIVFVQCRNSNGMQADKTVNGWYKLFDDLAESMVHRRDIAFFSVAECTGFTPGKDGTVRALRIRDRPTTRELEDLMFRTNREPSPVLFVPPEPQRRAPDVTTTTDASHLLKVDTVDTRHNLTLTQFVVTQSTPTVLWYDRHISAPMAFPLYRKVHAVLFVDLHHVPSSQDEKSKKVKRMEERVEANNRLSIRQFKEAALDHRINKPLDNVVFLIVPSTETRILTTFGVDVWSPVDEFVNGQRRGKEEMEEECRLGEEVEDAGGAAADADGIGISGPKEVLPTLLITDRRFGGTTRYYLDAPEILRGGNHPSSTSDDDDDGPSPIQRFLTDFWNDDLTPEVQSQTWSGGDRNVTNESGVQIVTGNTFRSAVLDRTERHTLIHFYGRTCGHCKRFQLVWNELSRLMRHLHWDTFLDVMKMDITMNEIPPQLGLDVRLVPDVYYFPAGAEKSRATPVRYDVLDEAGDGAGRLTDPLDIVDWVLEVAGENLDVEGLLRNLVEEKEVGVEVEAAPDDET